MEVRRGSAIGCLRPGLPTLLPFTIDGSPVGNTIKGQLRVERFLKLGSDSQLTLQGALSEPLNSAKTPDISLDEDNGCRTRKDALLLVWESRRASACCSSVPWRSVSQAW